ncbi:MAG: hypothetical protein ACE37H_03860 [Phycisphaeraceae bacterium]
MRLPGLAIMLLFALSSALTGCQVVDEATGVGNANVGQSLQQPAGTLTRKELSQKLRRLAMSYLGEVPESCELIASANPSLEQRLLALRIRADSSDSVIAIAADPDPQVALLNMVTIMTLQRMLAEERAQEFFGDLGPLYLNSARRMEDEAWKLAAQAMDAKEQQELRSLIVQYRKDHPNEVYVWWVRFSEFSGYKEQFSVAGIGQGIVDIFVPVGSAVSGIESTTDVAERATWLAARQALIIQWRVELMYLQTLAAPETQRLLTDVERVSDTVDKLPERVAKEREAIFSAIDEREQALGKLVGDANDTVKQVRGSIADAKQVVEQVDKTVQNAGTTVATIQDTLKQADASLEKARAVLPESESALKQLDTTSATLNETVKSVDALLKQLEPDPDEPPGRPFDITEYTQAAQELGKTVEQLNTLVNNIDETAEPTRLDATLQRVEGRASALIWQAGFVAVAVGLLLILAMKLIPRRQAA